MSVSPKTPIMPPDSAASAPAVSRSGILCLAGAALLCAAALLIWWPGVSAYDSVEQYKQVLSGIYTDWHPPIMARLWALLHPLGPGAAPMFVLQVGLYWLGFGLVAAALARSGRARAALAALAIGALPLLAGWQASVLKDSQMLAAMLAAVGLVARWRLAERPMPRAAIGAVVLLLGYAVLVRANAVFAVMPLAATLWPGPARPWRRAVAVVIGTALVVALTPAINHRLLGADETMVTRTLPIFDLAGIAHFSDADDVLTPEERALIAARHCYTPFFWDPLGNDAHCGHVAVRLDDLPRSMFDRLWLSAIAHHPLAYAQHRLVHLNSTERLAVGLGLDSAVPPAKSEPNDVGLPSPGAAARGISAVNAWLIDTPLGWPAVWIMLAMIGIWAALERPRGPMRDLALALAVSALCLEASFAVVSIASDLRYHLWTIAATALMLVFLLADRPMPRRLMVISGALLVLVVAIGITARIALPHAPVGYQADLG